MIIIVRQEDYIPSHIIYKNYSIRIRYIFKY